MFSYNGKLLQNIHRSKHGLTILSTGEKTTTNLKGKLPGYGEVWYHPKGIANIISISWVAYKYQAKLASVIGNQFHVFLQNNKICRFIQCLQGLYYSDIKDETANILINAVAYNQSKYSPRDYFKALDDK